MPKVRWTLALTGAAIFLAAHAIEVAAQIGGRDPWFISAWPSTVMTAALMFATAVVAGTRTRGPAAAAFAAGALLSAGALVPLVITLFAHPRGPGTLFPIAIALGGVLLACVSVVGALGGWLIRRQF